MSFTEAIPYIDLIGYLGGGITVWGIYQKTMIPLRVGAVCGNVGFLIFGLLATSYPTLILHSLLLPLNVYRMAQMIRLVREIREAASETVYQKTNVCGNVGFLIFGLLATSYPTLILHSLLLPLNVYRMAQMIRLVRDPRSRERDEQPGPASSLHDRETGKGGNGLVSHQ